MSVTGIAVAQKVFYVSASGSDKNRGTLKKPFATIDKALSVVRKANASMKEDITVCLRGGVYQVDKPILLDEKLSGNNGHYVIIKAYEGETPVIDGGKAITGWVQERGSPLWKAKLDHNQKIRHLFVNGTRVRIASSSAPVRGTAAYMNHHGQHEGIYLEGFSHLNRNPEDMELFWYPEWRIVMHPVSKLLHKPDRQSLFLLKMPYYANILYQYTGPKKDHRSEFYNEFYIRNAYELLDEPGEWYFDKTRKEIYYYPQAGQQPDRSDVYYPLAESLLEIRGESKEKRVSHIKISGLTFRNATWNEPTELGIGVLQAQCYYNQVSGQKEFKMIPASVNVSFASGIVFEKNAFTNNGSGALAVVDHVENCTISGNYFYDTGDAAIIIGHLNHHSQRENICKNIQVHNNLIRKIGQEFWSAPAIAYYFGENIEIRNNDIADVPYTGISGGWGWRDTIVAGKVISIKNNRIQRCMTRLHDGAGIYTLSAHPKTVIEGNYIKSSPFIGIYTDEGTSYVKVQYNVLENIGFQWQKYTRNSRSNLIANNFSTNGFMSAPRQLRNNVIDNKHQGNLLVEDRAWPEQARQIMDKAGLEPDYQCLLKKVPNYEVVLLNDNYDFQGWVYKYELKNMKKWLLSPVEEENTACTIEKELFSHPGYNGIVALYDNNSGGRVAFSRPFEPAKGRLEISWRFNPTACNENTYTLSHNGDDIFSLVLNKNILYINSSGTKTSLGQVKEGQWNDIMLFIDTDSGNVTSRLNKSGVPVEVKLQNLPAGLDKITIATGIEDQAARLKFDDLKVIKKR